MDSFLSYAEYYLSTWEFWQWVIDKVIYLAAIFGAAYWAQRIFNKKAQGRENRERRLQRIEEMIGDVVKLTEAWNRYLTLKIVSPDSQQYLIQMSTPTMSLRTYAHTYNFDISGDLDGFQGMVDEIVDEVNKRRQYGQLAKPGEHMIYDVPSKLEGSKIHGYLAGVLEQLKSEHSHIENNH